MSKAPPKNSIFWKAMVGPMPRKPITLPKRKPPPPRRKPAR